MSERGQHHTSCPAIRDGVCICTELAPASPPRVDEHRPHCATTLGYNACTCAVVSAGTEAGDDGVHARGQMHTSTNVDPETTDPTAGDRAHGCRWSEARSRWETVMWPGVSKEACGHLAHTRRDEMYFPDERPAEPDAGDVDALDRLLSDFYHSDDGDYVSARGDLIRYVDAVRRKAGDERAEQIAQAIEAQIERWRRVDSEATTEAGLALLRIARESR